MITVCHKLIEPARDYELFHSPILCIAIFKFWIFIQYQKYSAPVYQSVLMGPDISQEAK